MTDMYLASAMNFESMKMVMPMVHKSCIQFSSSEKFSGAIGNVVRKLLLNEKPLWLPVADGLTPAPNAVQLVEELWRTHCPEIDVQGPLKLIVGVSGGADSTCLLAVLSLLSSLLDLEVAGAHVAYGFRGRESEQEIVFLEQLCMRLKVPLHIYTLNKADRVRLSSGNLQAVARDIRRTYFETLMINGTYLCLGHNLSDNCETFLLRLLSGSGLKGLSSMGSLSKICNYSGNVDSIEAPKNEEPAKAQGFILRPLLNTRRELLEQWLSLNSIEHCHDSSNSTDKYKRNQIRHHLIPLIQRIEPAALDVIDQSLKLMAVDSSFLEEEAEMACNKILKNEFAGGKSVACDSLRGLHRAISSRVIRSLIEGVGFSRGVRCSYLLTEEILAMVWSEKSTALSSIRKHIQIALFRNRIWVFPIGEVNKFSLVVNYSDQGLSVQKSEESGSPEVLNNNDIKIGNSVFSEQNSVINCQGCHWSFDVRICDDLPSLSMKIRNYSEPGLSPMVYVGRLNDDVFPLTIRAFNTGDRLVAVKEGISKKVSSILGERGVPQYLRELWPVMLSGNNIIWVGGFRCSTPCDLKEDQGPFFVVEISPLLKGL